MLAGAPCGREASRHARRPRADVVHHQRHPEALTIPGAICLLSACEARPHQSAAACRAAHLRGVMETLPQQVMMSRRIAAVPQEQRWSGEAERRVGSTRRAAAACRRIQTLFYLPPLGEPGRCWWNPLPGFPEREGKLSCICVLAIRRRTEGQISVDSVACRPRQVLQ